MERKLLKEAGLKATPRRCAMLRILADSGEGLAAEEIYEKLPEEQSCDLSTVYRALNSMSERHLLHKSPHQDGRIYYQFNREHHSHRLICERCHESILIDSCPLEQLERDLRANTGYQITGHRFEISGVCPQCAQKEKLKKR